MSSTCFHLETCFLVYDSTMKETKNLQPGYLLMGEDGTPRKITNITIHSDNLIKIPPLGQSSTKPMVVDSNGYLSLVCGSRPNISKDTRSNAYVLQWFNGTNIKSKSFMVNEDKAKISFQTKEEALAAARAFNDSIDRQPENKSNYEARKMHMTQVKTLEGYYSVTNNRKSILFV